MLNALLHRHGCSWGGLEEVCALVIPQAATPSSREDSSACTLAARAPSQSLARAIALAQVLAQTPETVRASARKGEEDAGSEAESALPEQRFPSGQFVFAVFLSLGPSCLATG